MSKNDLNWPLCADVFTFRDKLKISKFLFTEKIWTYGKHIRRYEKRWEQELVGFPKSHAIMVSSGSAANELIALRRKWELQQAGEWPKRNKVLFPVNTWISSVSPWINCGFEPVFMDVQPNNMNSDSTDILKAFEKYPNIGTVFYTALLGFFGDLWQCMEVCEKHNVRFLMDNCEASFSTILDDRDLWNHWYVSLCSLTTCSTSIFYSHFTTSGTEGGLIFTQSEEEADWFRMARNHGMTRGMPEKYKNKDVNPDFDFYLMGSNYRSSNLQAYMASLDFERAIKFNEERCIAWSRFNDALFGHREKFKWIFNNQKGSVVPLAIPIVATTPEFKNKAEGYLKARGVMTRPIIAGNLLRHTAFKQYGNPEDFPVADHFHKCGLYIGLHKNVTKQMIKELTDGLKTL